jgi:DNA invertase Pin-like site-specific DNA recombinase
MSFMSAFLKLIRQPLGAILPLNDVKRRVIVDALDKCGGNYCLAARLLGIGKTTVYRMARQYNYQPPQMQGRSLLIISQRKPGVGLGQPTANA